MPLGPIVEIEVRLRNPTPEWIIVLIYTDGRKYQIEPSQSQMWDFLGWVKDAIQYGGAKVIPGMFGYKIFWEEDNISKEGK